MSRCSIYGTAWVSFLVLALGCSSPERTPSTDPAAQRARDSVIGQSKLPGAAGVRGALRAADSAEARRVREDSASKP